MTLSWGTPDWSPLEAIFTPAECADFMYMGRSGSIVLYKHYLTRAYLNIDAGTGRFYRYQNGEYIEISRGMALTNVGIVRDQRSC